MSRMLVPILVSLVLAAPASATTIPSSSQNALAGGPQTITFAPFAYSPSDLAISPGAVTWSGALASHPLTFDDGTPGSSTGVLFARTLSPGIVRYYCGIHGGRNGLGMSGVIYVAGPAARLVASPASLTAPGVVTLDASTTDFVDYTPNTTATYAFDADGDGTFETSGGLPTTQASFPLGTTTAHVRVTDDDGRVGEATVVVHVGETPVGGQPAGGQIPGGTGAPGDGGGGTAADKTRPTLSARSLAAVRLGAFTASTVRLNVGTLSERAVVRATLRLKRQTIARAKTRTVGAGSLRVTLSSSRAGRSALRGLRRATLVLHLELTDLAGNRRVIDRTLHPHR